MYRTPLPPLTYKNENMAWLRVFFFFFLAHVRLKFWDKTSKSWPYLTILTLSRNAAFISQFWTCILNSTFSLRILTFHKNKIKNKTLAFSSKFDFFFYLKYLTYFKISAIFITMLTFLKILTSFSTFDFLLNI